MYHMWYVSCILVGPTAYDLLVFFFSQMWNGINSVNILYSVTSYKADVSSVSPLSERMEELWVVCGYIWRVEWENSDEKNMNKLLDWKAFVDTYGIKSADLKNKLLFKSFAAFRAT